jgi:hypothetical protein
VTPCSKSSMLLPVITLNRSIQTSIQTQRQ